MWVDSSAEVVFEDLSLPSYILFVNYLEMNKLSCIKKMFFGHYGIGLEMKTMFHPFY